MIWVCGPDRKCVHVNRPWLEFTGRSLEEEVNRGWPDAIHPEDRARAEEMYRAALRVETPRGIRSAGTAIYYLLTSDPDSFSALHRLPTEEVYHFYLQVVRDPVHHPDG